MGVRAVEWLRQGCRAALAPVCAICWGRLALLVAALATSATAGAAGATYALLAHGRTLGQPIAILGAKIFEAGVPVEIDPADRAIATLIGEMGEPQPTPITRGPEKPKRR